jgi:hypothetical protein
VAAADLDERIDVAEVDERDLVGLCEPERPLMAVCHDNPKSGRPRIPDRRELGDASSEDQHRLHLGPIVGGRRSRKALAPRRLTGWPANA